MDGYEQIRKSYEEQILKNYISEKYQQRGFEYYVREISKTVSEYARGKEIALEDFEWNVLPQAMEVLEDLRLAMISYKDLSLTWDDDFDKNEEAERLDSSNNEINYFWTHERNPLHRIKSNNIPHLDRFSIENVCDRYLKEPWRCEALDRLLIDVLVAMELYAFGDEMINEETYWLAPKRSPLKQRHIFFQYLRGQLLNATLIAMFVGGAIWIDQSWVFWLAVVPVVILMAFSVISTGALPFAWRQQSKAKGRVVDLIGAMSGVYAELMSDGPISASHIKYRLEDVAAKGVVWPAPVFAVLEDVLGRTGRF